MIEVLDDGGDLESVISDKEQFSSKQSLIGHSSYDADSSDLRMTVEIPGHKHSLICVEQAVRFNLPKLVDS